jgi:hypothetical protein
VSVEHSRALKLGECVSGKSASSLERHLDSSTVVVSVESEMPQSHLVARTLVATLRRGPGEIVLIATGLEDSFITELQEASAAIDPRRGITVLSGSDPIAKGSVRVHVGPTIQAPAIRIVPEGHGAHIAASSAAVIRIRRPGNEIGAVYSAALGAAEVFKHTALVSANRRVFHRHLRYCPISLNSDLLAAPDLPTRRAYDLTLAGVGAIGTGIVLLLDALGAEGRIVLIDRQRFAPENLGTYSIGGVADVEECRWKVDLAKRYLRRFDIVPVRAAVSDAIQSVDAGKIPWTPVVLSALDSPEARRDVQRLWPDRLVDAQTGDTMLGFCDCRHGIDPCMFCVFPPGQGPSGAELVAERLGLSVQELADPDAVLTEANLHGKTAEQQRLLRPHVGKPMCGLAQATGLSGLDADGFMPSVPFISLQAACLSVARLVAATNGSYTVGYNFAQYDGLFGPQAATIETMKRRPGCLCDARATSIDLVRNRRRLQQRSN